MQTESFEKWQRVCLRRETAAGGFSLTKRRFATIINIEKVLPETVSP